MNTRSVRKVVKGKSQTKNRGAELVQRLERFSEELEKAESVSDVFTVRAVRANIEPKSSSAGELKKARNILRMSQGVFAKFVGMSPSTIQDWEQGVNPPAGPVCRLIDEIIHAPTYFRARVRSLVAVSAGGSRTKKKSTFCQ